VLETSRAELRSLRLLLKEFPVLHIDEGVSEILSGLVISHHNLHSRWIPDSFIASAALYHGLELFTLNRQDYEFIKNLKLFSPQHPEEDA